ncbi:INO80 complex subunit B [Coemansia sp. RSA 2708]|nr:INO80 complex subunit B [Coemansia sp. RSA 2708]
MPPKRKITNDDSTTPSSTGSEASEPETPSTRRTRARRRDDRGSANPQASPALNTRRSSRLSAGAEDPAKPRARLTRGLRRDSDAAATASPVPTRGRGSRGGRGRGRPRGGGRGGGPKRGAAAAGKRGRGRPRAGESDIPSESESESEVDDDDDEIEDFAVLDKTESDNVSGSEAEDGSEPSDGPDERSPGSNQGDELRDVDSSKPEELPESDESNGEGEPELDVVSGLSEGEGELLLASTSMTRRQRAKLNRETGEELMSLPAQAKRSRFSAEEAALRKSEHARRRKFQSLQRAEQIKNDTINRLLNKQTSKGRNKVTEEAETRSGSVESNPEPEQLRYIQRRRPQSAADGNPEAGSEESPPVHIECALLLPQDTTIADLFPTATSKGAAPAYPNPVPTCAVTGCEMAKKYTAASQPACSLEHWRMLKESSAGPAA